MYGHILNLYDHSLKMCEILNEGWPSLFWGTQALRYY